MPVLHGASTRKPPCRAERERVCEGLLLLCKKTEKALLSRAMLVRLPRSTDKYWNPVRPDRSQRLPSQHRRRPHRRHPSKCTLTAGTASAAHEHSCQSKQTTHIRPRNSRSPLPHTILDTASQAYRVSAPGSAPAGGRQSKAASRHLHRG